MSVDANHSRNAPDGEAAQPVAVHASRQLERGLAHAAPPVGAVQCAASDLMLHFVVPLAFVRQQAIAPGLPHVECAAPFLSVFLQLFAMLPAFTPSFTACWTQLT